MLRTKSVWPIILKWGLNVMNIPIFVDRVAKQRNCSPELIGVIMSDCLAELHEATFKWGIGLAAWAAYANFGQLAGWHFAGLIIDAARDGDPDELAEHCRRMDHSEGRFDHFIEHWAAELKRERGEE